MPCSGREPATLCPENQHGAARSGYSTCGKLVYRASQFEADAQIGRLLDYLDGQRLSNETLVICEYPPPSPQFRALTPSCRGR